MTAFLMIFRRFPTTFRWFSKIFQNCSEGQTNVLEHFPENFRKFPTMSKDCRRLSSKTRRFFYDTPTNLSKISETNLISLKSSTSSHVRICSHVRIVFINLLPLNISLTYIIKENFVGVHAREVIHFSRTLHAGIKDEISQACASWSIERAHILFKRHFSMT